MNPFHRPLSGMRVGLSISESHDSIQAGYPEWQVNHVTVQLVAALFGQGAGVVFGHDWRDDGVMDAVYAFARAMQAATPGDGEKEDPLLRNLLPWPDQPRLTPMEQKELGSTLRIEEAGLPTELQPYAPEAATSRRLYTYLRSRGLTHLRQRLNETTNARLCCGGRTSSFQGRYPGIIEEALLAVHTGKPLFLVGLLGGATAQVIGALQGEAPPEASQTRSEIRATYENPPARESDEKTWADRIVNEAEVWELFRTAGVQEIAARNALSTEENLELFRSPSFERIVELLLIGLRRLREEH